VSTVRESIEQSPGDRDDAKLVAAARRGELAAFDALVVRYQRQATSVAYRLLNNMDDALEVVQDAFLRAYEKLASLDKNERFGPWLLRIVSNLSLNKRRFRWVRRGVSLDAGSDDEDGGSMQVADPSDVAPDEAASADEIKQRMHEAIAELPDMQRKALVMFCLEQRPQKEIAQMLECSVEAVKWHVFTARKKLKERLKDYM